MVVPAALLVELLWRQAGGEAIPDAEKAKATIESLHVLGVTPIYAAYTGVLLWLSAVLSGWIENWATYRRLPEALAHQPRLVYAFGSERMQRGGAWFARNVAGLGGNIALGFLLGMTPVVAEFFRRAARGASRHADHGGACTCGQHARHPRCLPRPHSGWHAPAIAVVGVLNLSVSFTLALWGGDSRDARGSLVAAARIRAVIARLLAAPRDFLLQPTRAAAPTATKAARV